jgi:hypothetical protein
LGSEQDVAEVLVSLAWAYRRDPSIGLRTGPATGQRGAERRRSQEALDAAIRRARRLASRLGRGDLLTRLHWLEAEIAQASGRTAEAHAAYGRAVESSGPMKRSCDNDRLIALHRETEARMEALRDL